MKCKIAVCGKLECCHNKYGQCHIKVIALDKDGECLCFEKHPHNEKKKKKTSIDWEKEMTPFEDLEPNI